MAEERVKCPFCSELILPDAIKCRFCEEWLSREEEAIENSGPGEHVGHASGDQGREPAMPGGLQGHPVPQGRVQGQNDEAKEADDDHKDEHQEAVNESPVRVVSYDPDGDRSARNPFKKRRRIPWLRIILVVVYLGIAVALGVCEFYAQRAVREGRASENAKDYKVAFNTYRNVMETFPFSLAAIETRQGLRRISESDEFEMPRPSWLLEIEDLWGREFNARDVYLLPFAVWPVCAVLLFLVFVTRILRPLTAFVALLLMIVAIAGAVVQLVWCGIVSLVPVAEVAQGLIQAPVAVYCASYLLVALTALMTLTATRKKISVEVGKMATASAKRR